jgi:hypothetical protein
VVLTIVRKSSGYKFKKKVKIIGVLDDFIRAKGASGMETAIPMDDEYMRVDGIRVLFPEI